MKKPFSQKLYKQDDNAKHQVVGWLHRRGFDAEVNPDQYGIDVLAYKHGLIYKFEVEVKHNWTTTVFPFETVHFSARKKKFIGPNTYFTMLNNQRNRVLIVDDESLKSASTVTKSTTYTSLESFIEVPYSSCRIYTIREK